MSGVLTYVGTVGFALPLGWSVAASRGFQAYLAAALVAVMATATAAFVAGDPDAAAIAAAGLAAGGGIQLLIHQFLTKYMKKRR